MRVVVAEDSLLTREGIVRILQGSGYTIAGTANDLPSLLHAVALETPDLVVTDIRMPPTHTDEGLVAARQIRDEHPRIGILVLSQYIEPTYALRLVEDHPSGVGYLLKERVFDPAILIDAIRRIADDETVIDPSIVSRLLGRHRRDNPLARLSPREHEVLGLIAQGLSNAAVARELFVTERTVQAHTTSIFQKLQLPQDVDSHRRVLAVVAYLHRATEP